MGLRIKNIVLLISLAVFLTGCGLVVDETQPASMLAEENNAMQSEDGSANKPDMLWHIKFVPANVDENDLNKIAQAGFKILSSEGGINDVDIQDMQETLDRVQAQGLQMIMDGGFSAGAWGYKDDGSDPIDQQPVWQPEKMQAWVRQFKDHPAVFGWDISNEAGENLPNGNKFRLSLNQLQQVAADVRAIDTQHPIIIRMHYWDEYDGDFGKSNPFAAGIADIVILNLYSNYSEDGQQVLLPNMLADSAQLLVDKILTVDPQVQVWISLATWQDKPMFLKPTASQVARDIQAGLQVDKIQSIGFFGWGAEDENWYLPRDGNDLIKIINNYIIKN